MYPMLEYLKFRINNFNVKTLFYGKNCKLENIQIFEHGSLVDLTNNILFRIIGFHGIV